MNHFLVNGVERPMPVGAEDKLGQLLGYIHEKMTNEKSLVSSIRVDGIEIGNDDEGQLAEVRLSELESVEVTFAHPRELAEETLQLLKAFTARLTGLSREVTASTGVEAQRSFERLIDGIQTFSDTVLSVKMMLRIGLLPPVQVLEADLLSILKDLLQTLETGDHAYRTDLLNIHLPANLEAWCSEGIPALIRSRDS